MHQLAALTVLVAVFVDAEALTCYVSAENGTLVETTKQSWTFCSFIPYFYENGRHFAKEAAFGVGPQNGLTDVFGLSFDSTEPLLTVLAFCVMEQYNFEKSRDLFGRRHKHTERMFRCVCNTNLCNHPQQFRVFTGFKSHAN